MKRFQSIIQNYITNHQKHKKYLAAVLALSVLVSFGVSAGLIEPAVSTTGGEGEGVALPMSLSRSGDQMLSNYAGTDGNVKDNVTYSPAEMSAIDLLIGSSTGNALSWADGCTTVSQVVEKAKDTYFLGIAYDFCLFLEGDADLKDADAEGRVAVGGNLKFKDEYDYQVGSGNFGYMTALKDTDDYSTITGFAHAIVGGYMKNIHPLSTGNNKTRVNNKVESIGGHQGYGNTLYFPPTEDEFKRFVVGDATNSSSTHMHCAGNTEQYRINGSHDDVSVNELAEMYHQPEGGIINFTDTFAWLRERSQALGEKEATGTVSTDGNKITFTIPESMTSAETVYFNLPDGVDYEKLEEINFVGVPLETTQMVVRETETDELKTVTKKIPACNLVINSLNTTFNIRGTDNTAVTKITYTDGTTDTISNSRDEKRRDEYNDDVYHSNADPEVMGWRSNNHPASSKILYNFPNATGVCYINGNFNGTIFAPNADVKSDDGCTGHLSGALIAKSFTGGLEFGYRPYRGTSDILGGKSGYGVPIRKLIADTNTGLEGATFGIFEVGNDTAITTFTSDDKGDAYVNIESQVDFTGGTAYSSESHIITKNYVIKEIKAPAGFVKDNSQAYNITVVEDVSVDDIKYIDGKPIPTKVTTVITQGNETFKIELQDIYSYENGSDRRIMRELKIYDNDDFKDNFQMVISADGKVTSVRNGSNGSETITKYSPSGETVMLISENEVKKELPVYEVEGKEIYKLDSENYKYVDGKFFTDDFTVEDGKIYTKDGKVVKSKTDTGYKDVSVSNYADNVQYVNKDGSKADIGEVEPTLKLEPVNEEVDNLIYTFSDGSYIHYNSDKWTYVKDGQETEVENKDGKWVYKNDSDEEVIINSDDNQPTIEIESFKGDDSLSWSSRYEIGNIAWNNGNYPQVDKLIFYYNNGTSKSINFKVTRVNDGWYPFELSCDDSDFKKDVIGIKVITSENNNTTQLYVQDASSWKNIEAWSGKTFTDGKICIGKTPDATHIETTYVPKTEKNIPITMLDAYQVPVLNSEELHLLNYEMYSGESAQTAKDYTSSSEMVYKYDPETMMLMPQPTAKKTFTNKRGLIFRKVSQLGADTSALKGATINIKKLTGWGTGDDINKPIGEEVTGMNNILAGDSETTVDVSKLDATIYYFEETATPDNTKYEIADPIYFKKSGDIIYYTKDANKAKQTDTTGWDSVNITNTENNAITMVDIQISGAKIKLGKYNDTFSIPLSAEFKLCTNSGDVIYPLNADSFTISAEEEYDLFTLLRNADESMCDTNYIKNGYLKPGTYILKEITQPTGYDKQEEFRFKVENDYSVVKIESGTPSGYAGELERLDAGAVRVYPADAEGNRITLSKIEKIEIEIADGYDLDNYIKLYETDNSSLEGKQIKLSNCETNINNCSVEYSGGKITLTFNPEFTETIKKFKIQTDGGTNKPITVNSVYITGEAGEGGDSGNTTPTPYTIGNVLYNANGSLPNIKKVTFYYEKGEPAYVENVELDYVDDYNHPFKLNLNKENVIGIKIETGNEGDDWKALTIQDNSGKTIFGTDWNGSVKLSKNQELLLGYDKMPEQEQPTTPSDSDETKLLDVNVVETNNNYLIRIPNQKTGNNLKLTIEKTWEDTGFDSLRPDEITVYIKRKLPNGSEDTEFNNNSANKVTIAKTDDWKKQFGPYDRLTNDTAEDIPANQYKYYIEEVVPEGYALSSYSENNTTGITATDVITITNTLVTKDISVTKQWFESDGTTPITEDTPSVTVELKYCKDSSENYVSFNPSKTLILNSANVYTGSFTGLPANWNYNVVEVSTLTGWNSTVTKSGNGFTVTNTRDSGSLTIKKEWENDSATNRPNEIYMAIYRTTEQLSSSGSSTGSSSTSGANSSVIKNAPKFSVNSTNLYPDYNSAEYKNVTDNSGNTVDVDQYNDYARLLQYSLYFYDANMCGSQAEETSAYTWRTDCHTYDGMVDGGFHDAGDHVMFGLPQGFTASTLGWSYYEFKDSFDSLGLTDHYKTIMKYFCDFFVASTKLDSNGEVSKFLYQKGTGGTDHSYWGSPELQSESDFGQKEYWTTNGASDIAANYAATLAQYSLNFPNDPQSSTYLEYAKALYDFSTKYNTCTSDGPSGFYWDERTEPTDEQAWAAAWLYLATKDSTYKTACQEKTIEAQRILNSWEESKREPRGHFWNNVTLGAATVYASHIDKTNTDIKKIVTDYLTKNCAETDYKVVDWGTWGSARHNTLLQTVALSATKNIEGVNYSAWCQKQMRMILGDNDKKICLVTGFAENSATSPHHRAASGLNDWEGTWGFNTWTNVEKSYEQIPNSHVIVGALTNGPSNSSFSSYIDRIGDGTDNEIALDYNAGLVGAAAGLYAIYGTGAVYENDTPQPQLLLSNSVQSVFTDLSAFGVKSNAVLASENYPTEINEAGATVTKTDNGDGTYKFEFVIPKDKNRQDHQWDSNFINDVKISGLNLNNVTKIVFNTNIYNSAFTCNDAPEICEQFNQNSTFYDGVGCDVSYIKLSNIKWWGETDKDLIITCTFTIGEGSGGGGDTPTPTPDPDPEPSGEVIDCGNGITATINGNIVTYTFSQGYYNQDAFKVVKAGKIVSAEMSDYNNKDNGNDGNWWKKLVYDDGTWHDIIDDFSSKKSDLNYSVLTTNNLVLQNFKHDAVFTLTLEYEVETFKIIEDSITITEDESGTLNANMPASSWETDNNAVTLTPSADGMSCTVHADSYYNGDITITATSEDGTVSDTAKVRINGANMSVKDDNNDPISDITLHVGDSKTVNVEPADADASTADENIATVGNMARSADSFVITATGAGDTTISFSRNGKSANVTVHVLERPVISGLTKMNKNSTQRLAVSNAIGDVSWSISGDSSITIDPDGTVHSGATSGVTATVIATDADGCETTPFPIIIELTAIEVDVSNMGEPVQIITLTSANNWSSGAISLDKTDAEGHEYHYYVVEVDENGNPVTEIDGKGNAKYIPVNYDNNGKVLGNGLTISVRNEKEDTGETPEYTLPSTGGTGTKWYYITGMAIMLMPAVILAKRRKKST